MGDMADTFRAYRAYQKDRKARLGVDCPGCPKVQPKRIPTVLLPGQRCKVCGYRDPRKDDRPRVVDISQFGDERGSRVETSGAVPTNPEIGVRASIRPNVATVDNTATVAEHSDQNPKAAEPPQATACAEDSAAITKG